jgi:hypothetical protein
MNLTRAVVGSYEVGGVWVRIYAQPTPPKRTLHQGLGTNKQTNKQTSKQTKKKQKQKNNNNSSSRQREREPQGGRESGGKHNVTFWVLSRSVLPARVNEWK